MSRLEEWRRETLMTPCPFCDQPAGQRCIVKGSGDRGRHVPPDYYGPYGFHAARGRAAKAGGGDHAG